MKLPWDCVLFFLVFGGATWELICYTKSKGIFFQLGIVHEVTWPDFTLWFLDWLWVFLLDCEFLAGTCVLLKCFCTVLSFLKADNI